MPNVERRSRASRLYGIASWALLVAFVAGELYQLYDPRFKRLSVLVDIDRLSRYDKMGVSGSWMAILAAYVLFQLKIEGRFFYGIVELIFALVTTWLWATTTSGALTGWGSSAQFIYS